MKKRIVLVICCMAIAWSSYSQKDEFYQMYDAQSTDAILNKTMAYTDQNCTISYDFWERGGNAGFCIRNNTDKALYLDLSKTFLVCNGMAYDFYQSRRNRDGNVYHVETGDFFIPAHTARMVTCDYSIYENVYANCDMGLYPIVNHTWEKVKDAYFNDPRLSESFSRESSPMVFKFIINYRKESSDEVIGVENEFYISRVTNFCKDLFFEKNIKVFECGKEVVRKGLLFRLEQRSRFYNKYSSEYEERRY